MFTGDFCSENPQSIQISNRLSEIMKTCDIKCLNFEAPLAYGALKSPNGNKLIQSNISPSWVENNDFNLVSLANNHMFDYGTEGLLATKEAFKRCVTIGAGNWNEAYEVKYIEIKGVKIGFFSGTSGDFASLKDDWTDKQKIGCAWINHKEVNNIIKSAKKQCDYLIVLSHGGIEFMDVPLPEWRDRYRELIDMGADAIIGSHPHVPQGTEKYKDRPIFYSLGNFFFDNESLKKPLYWDNGVLAILEIENGIVNYSSVPIIKNNSLLDIDTSENTAEHLKNLTDILSNDEQYINKVNSEVLRLYNKYMNWLFAGYKAVELKFNVKNLIQIVRTILFIKHNDKVTLHQIREESTRWLVTRALKLKSKTEL